MDSSGPAIVLQPVGQAMDERSYGQGFEIESNQLREFLVEGIDLALLLVFTFVSFENFS